MKPEIIIPWWIASLIWAYVIGKMVEQRHWKRWLKKGEKYPDG